MEGNFPFLEIVLFAMVAGFLILRLRSVLGRRTGNERRRPDPITARTAAEEAREREVGTLPDRARQPAPEMVPAAVASPAAKVRAAKRMLAVPLRVPGFVTACQEQNSVKPLVKAAKPAAPCLTARGLEALGSGAGK